MAVSGVENQSKRTRCRVGWWGVVLLVVCPSLGAQVTPRMEQDPTRNNLVHPEGHPTAPAGTLGEVLWRGEGPVDLVLIAGAGFGGDVFEEFMQRHSADYRMAAVTLPGFGGSLAPPMPPAKTSYGELSWTRSVRDAVAELIVREELDRPVVVGHWLAATTVAIELALERPDLVRGAVVVSGVPKFVPMEGSGMAEPETVAQRVAMVDHYLAPEWFKTVTRATWDDGNFLPRDYAIHPLRAQQLWIEAARASLPVWIRYLCEAWAQDSTAELGELQVPLLVLQPELDSLYHQGPQTGAYLDAFLHRAWEGVDSRFENVTVATIHDSRVFIMDDQPELLSEAVVRFVAEASARPRTVRTPRLRPPAPDPLALWGGTVVGEGDHYDLTDAGVSIRRPDASWTLEPVLEEPPLLARLWDEEESATVTLQVRPTMGFALEELIPMVLSNLSQQLADFVLLSRERSRFGAQAGWRLEFRHRGEDSDPQTLLWVTDFDRGQMISLTAQAAVDRFEALRDPFAAMADSVRLEASTPAEGSE